MDYPPVAAVVATRSRVLATHLNSPKTHTEASNYYRQRLHAEHSALLEQKGDTLVVVRVSKDLKYVLNSKPCFRCMRLILEAKHIKKLVYMLNGHITKERVG